MQIGVDQKSGRPSLWDLKIRLAASTPHHSTLMGRALTRAQSIKEGSEMAAELSMRTTSKVQTSYQDGELKYLSPLLFFHVNFVFVNICFQ